MTVLAPVFVAAGNYMLITRLILAVLPTSRQRVLGIPGRWLTPIFVCFDIIAASVQGNGAGIAGSNDWQGEEERIGSKILIGGLAIQLAAFSLFLSALVRFHIVANRGPSYNAPKDWRKLVRAVYISSALIMVRIPGRLVRLSAVAILPDFALRFDPYSASPSLLRVLMDMLFRTNGPSGYSRLCLWPSPLPSSASTTRASILDSMEDGSCNQSPRAQSPTMPLKSEKPSMTTCRRLCWGVGLVDSCFT